MAYDMIDPFIIPTLVDDYVVAVEDSWGIRGAMGVYLLSHWSKVLLYVVVHSQMDSYENCSDDEDIASCKWTK